MTKENSLGTLGRYKILEEIGRGGFSVVYKAENVALKKTVAIKMMLPALFHDPESIERFIHEARTVAGLKHAHITRVVDLDEDEGRLFMALEYLPGGDLHSWIETHGRPSFRQSAGIMYDIAEALDYAHGEGVVHGDVKPGNILLNEAGRAKLTDFGILRAVESSGVTSADMTRGTPYYVSPEGAEGGRPTPLSDQYALGVVAYELLTGQVPFGGDTPLSIYLKHVREEPPSPSQLSPLVTPELENILLKALAKDPQARYPTCRAFALTLRDAVAATERDQFQELFARAEAALAAHDPETARPLLNDALQILPDDREARTLLARLEEQQRAQRGYADASEQLDAARNQAAALRISHPDHPDPETLIAELAPPEPPAWKLMLKRWRAGLYLAFVLVVAGIVGASIWSVYTKSSVGADHKSTVVAVRYGTPTFTRTPTHTLTLTPTQTYTPTFTSTFTLTPTLTPTPTQTYTPTLTFTPTLTPTPLAGATQISPQDDMVMVYIPAGYFEMGNENGDSDERHSVHLDSFWMDQTEVTMAQFQRFMQETGFAASLCGNGDDYPAACVDWYAAGEYCSWAGRRLPTEAEWEKAARGTDGRTYPWGEGIDCDKAQYSGCNGDALPVGSKPAGASPYGVLDMAGNVWEWVSSLYKGYPYDASDGREDLEVSGSRVLRGGSWDNDGRGVRSASRLRDSPDDTRSDFGFRCARSP